jgi:predicted phosphodiesterase
VTKAAFITDTHYGVRNDNAQFYDYMGNFYTNVFFPMLEQEGVQKVVHLGDVVDRRKHVNFLTAQHLRKHFFEPLQDMNMETDYIIGNHDTFFKNTNDVNALNELLVGYDNATVYTKATEIDLLGVKTLYVPWICPDNYEHSIDAIKTSNSTLALGHLEIAGFTMHAGHVMDDSGLSPDLFSRFELACSGHFHHRSRNGNINYLGAPYEMTWSDYGNTKGFHIYDTVTRELEFFQNPYTMFARVVVEDELDLDGLDIENKIVKLVVQGQATQNDINEWVTQLEQYNPHEIKVVDETNIFTDETGDITPENLQDTVSIVSQYIDTLETKVNRESIKRKVIDLYRNAMTVE